MSKTVLISGAGVAGPAVAWWLKRYGFVPTIVERAPQFRTGGYMIDFWGVGYDTAERMGILPALEVRGYLMKRLTIVDDRGQTRAQLDVNGMRDALAGRYFSITRSDLAWVVYDSIEGGVETIYGDSIAALGEDTGGVSARFEHAEPRRFDLVVGADGLHSRVRKLAFGPEETFEKYLGYYVATFIAPDYPHRDADTYVAYSQPGRQIGRYALRDGSTVFLLILAQDGRPAAHDIAAQKALLRDAFGRDGWEAREVLDRLDENGDLYFDAVSQIRMPSWSKGRVVLLGDSAFCPSLLAGYGTALAMAGAYLLAGELSKSGGDHSSAFEAYERKFRPFLEAKQDGATGFAGAFAPRTHFGIAFRNFVLNVMRLPGLSRMTMRSFLKDNFELPNYG